MDIGILSILARAIFACFIIFIIFIYMKDIEEKGYIRKIINKNKEYKYCIIGMISLFLILGFCSEIKYSLNREIIKIGNSHKYYDDLMKRSYQIVETEDGKFYAVIDRNFLVNKIIAAEVKKYNEIILEKSKNPYKGQDIRIDFSNIKMLDELDFHFVKDFEKAVFENRQFSKLKERNQIYIQGCLYNIIEETDNNITISFKDRIENKYILENNLDFYNGEKTLTILFDK